ALDDLRGRIRRGVISGAGAREASESRLPLSEDFGFHVVALGKKGKGSGGEADDCGANQPGQKRPSANRAKGEAEIARQLFGIEATQPIFPGLCLTQLGLSELIHLVPTSLCTPSL